MERFENAMITEGIPQKMMDKVRASYLWEKKFEHYAVVDINYLMIHFPKIYNVLNKPLNIWYSTPEQFHKAKKNYLPMEIS